MRAYPSIPLLLLLLSCHGGEAVLSTEAPVATTPPPRSWTTGIAVDEDGDGVANDLDCDDNDPTQYPGAPELCDGRDNDCNGIADEPFDEDGDGWGWCAGDCDDARPEIHPTADDLCDGLDNDCDGEMDEDDDLDGDGFASCRGDCDDTNPDVHLWAPEVCDGVDNDCNGTADDALDRDGDGYAPCGATPDCDDGNRDVHPGAVEVCNGVDDDCDGVMLPDEGDADGDGVPICAGDCDDADPARAAGFLDVCDGIDNDCDPATDENLDGDGDGASACGGDCDDTDALARPGGVETCNAADDDCDGVVDQGATCSPCTSWSYGGHAYLLCPTVTAWTTAQTNCRNWGYDLLSVGDIAEHAAVTLEVQARLGAATSPWCGYNDRAVEGAFAWSNGEAPAFEAWNAGEPNNSGNEDCTQINWGGGNWNDANCTTSLTYVCESL